MHATEVVMCNLPGFVSANLHISEDKSNIAYYAQWRSKADFAAMMANPYARGHMGEAAAVATSYSPVFYQLRETHAYQGA